MMVTNHNWNTSLRCLYSNSCEGIINKVLDTNNQLIFNGQDSKLVYTNVRCISLDQTATLALVRPEVRI